MNSEYDDPAKLLSDSVYRNRLTSLFLFAAYCSLLCYWFSSVVELVTPGLVTLCILLAWGSLKVNANWIVLGEFVVLVAKYGWQTPRIELIAGLWLSYVGILLFAFRANYSSLHQQLWQRMPILSSTGAVGKRKRALTLLSDVFVKSMSIFVFVTTGYFLLMYSPFGGRREAWINWSLERSEAMWPGGSVIVVLLGAVVFLREWNWRRISARQASLYLRTDRVSWQYRDLSRVVRLMMKARREKSRAD